MERDAEDARDIARVLAGDEAAFGALVARYQKPLFAMAWARTGDAQDAEDLCQEAFLRAYRALPTLRRHDRFAPWLYRILQNLVRQYFRGRVHLRQVAFEEAANDATLHSADPREQIQRQEQWQALWEQVYGLDTRTREAVVLHYNQGHSMGEIATLTGASEAAVKMRIMRARQRLAGDAAKLHETWTVAPAPVFHSKVLQGIAMTPALGFLAVAAGSGLATGWWLGKDLDRWRGQLSEANLRRSKWIILVCGLFFPAYLVALHLLRTAEFSPLWAMVPFLAIPLYGVYLGTRDIIALGDRHQQWRWGGYIGLVIVIVLLIQWEPGLMFFGLGVVFAAMFFVVEDGPALCAEPFGIWFRRLVHMPTPTQSPTSISEAQVEARLRLFYRRGLLRGPVKKSAASRTVCFETYETLFGRMTGAVGSTLSISDDGRVACYIAPKHYLQMRRDFPDWKLLDREALARHCAALFQKAFAAETDAAALATLDCVQEVPRSNQYVLTKYILPAMGVAQMILGLVDFFG